MTQTYKYRVIAACMITYSTTVEAESAERAGEIAFLQENPDWSEVGESDWQIDRVAPYVVNEPAPMPKDADAEAKQGKVFSDLLARRTHLLKLISELSETLQSGFLPPHAAQELTGRRYSARTELKGVEAAITKAAEGSK